MTAPDEYLSGLLARPGWCKLTADTIDPDSDDAFEQFVKEGPVTLLEWTRERAAADRGEPAPDMAALHARKAAAVAAHRERLRAGEAVRAQQQIAFNAELERCGEEITWHRGRIERVARPDQTPEQKMEAEMARSTNGAGTSSHEPIPDAPIWDYDDLDDEGAEPVPAAPFDSGLSTKLRSIWADSIDLDELAEAGVIDGLAPLVGLGVMYGESGSGKTFAAIDMACHVAAGMPWRGLGVEQGVVIYIAAEAPASIKRRIWAWKRHHGADELPVLVVTSPVDMLNGSTADLVALVQAVAKDHGRVAMVVVDTLARAMVGNENAPDDMGAFVGACERLRDAVQTFVLVVHHSGKDVARGARGHSCLRAASDLELEVTAGCVKCTKARDDEGGHSYGFRLHKVELGLNTKGRMVTTCVALAANAPAKADKAVTLTAKQKTTLDCLAAAIVDHGQPAPFAHDIPQSAKVVTFEHWRETALRYLPDDDKSTHHRRENFKRTVEALQAKGLARHVDGICWPCIAGPSHTSQPL